MFQISHNSLKRFTLILLIFLYIHINSVLYAYQMVNTHKSDKCFFVEKFSFNFHNTQISIKDFPKLSLEYKSNIQSLPSAPNLVLPLNNASVNYSKVTFVWTKAEPAVTRYQLDLAKDNSFTNVYSDSSIVATGKSQEKTDVYDLEPNTQYWWRIRAYNSDGWGPFSTVRTFETRPLSIEEYSIDKHSTYFEIIPIPANSTIAIRLKNIDILKQINDEIAIKIYDLNGNILKILSIAPEKFNESFDIVIDVSSLNNGVYFCQLTLKNYILTYSFIISK